MVDYLPITDVMLKELIPIEADTGEKLKELIKKVTPLYKKMIFETTVWIQL